jgi:epoxide hydrolase 4
MQRTTDILSEIQTEMVAANGLNFEVDMVGEGDHLIICLHGFPEHSVSWRFQLPYLARLGYRVWAPNLRGYGNSSAPSGIGAYSLENLMDDVAGLIDAAGCSEVTLMAHDWGAVIAWHFAMHRIRVIDRLVICNVPHPGPAAAAMSWAQLKKSWYILFFQLPGLPERMLLNSTGMGAMIQSTAAAPENFSEAVVALYDENAGRKDNVTAMINYYRGLVRGGGMRRQKRLGLPIIDVPTLMLWGEDDMALSIETTYGTENYVQDLTLRYLAGISHWVQQDAPEAVNAMLGAFLAGEPVPEYQTLVSAAPNNVVEPS